VAGSATFEDNGVRGKRGQYDAAGRIRDLTIDHSNNDYDSDHDFGYDATHQLTSADHDDQTDETYLYDDNGNRVTVDGSASYTTGDDNRLLSDGTYRFTYDKEGNRTLRFVDVNENEVLDSGDTGITQYTWDHRNRLTKVASFADYTGYSGAEADEIYEYTYDYLDRRIRKTADTDGDGTPESYAYNIHRGDDLALEITDQDGLAGGTYSPQMSHRYMYGQAVDQILAVEDDQEAVLWGLPDHEGTIRDVIDSTGNLDSHRDFDAFGRLVDGAIAEDFAFGFTGRPWDDDVDLYDFRARLYDPEVGRFASEDPSGFAGGDMNLYRYANNSPVMYVDPSGLGYSGFGDVARAIGGAVGTAVNYASYGVTETVKGGVNAALSARAQLDPYGTAPPRQNYSSRAAWHEATMAHARRLSADQGLEFFRSSWFTEQIVADKIAYAKTPLYERIGYTPPPPVIVPRRAGFFERAGNTVRWAANSVADKAEDLAVRSGIEPLAFVVGLEAQLLRSVGGVGAGVVDLPGTVKGAVKDAQTSIAVGKKHGAAVGVARQIGLLQLAEARYGTDVMTGRQVNAWDKIAEGSGRLGNTSLTLAGGLAKVPGLKVAPRGGTAGFVPVEVVPEGPSAAATQRVFSTGRSSSTATRPRGTQQTYEVIRRTDISWDQLRLGGDARAVGMSNAEAAFRYGLPPELPDGSFATLHHLGQDARGPLVEASTRYHGVGRPGQDILHSQYGRNRPHPTRPIDRRAFAVDSAEYWESRVH